MYDETEADTRANRIDPVLAAAGWGVSPGAQIRRELICPGRIQTGGRRGKSLACDYVLIYKGHKLATLEAKRAGLNFREGIGQAKDYAQRLGARWAFASNGIGWYQIDMATGEEGELALPFPTPDALWALAFSETNAWRERFGAVPFETDGGKWEPRYYQHQAIRAVLEAIAQETMRILLTLATGTGKTSIAFQIAWVLFQAKWNLSRTPSRRPRILFLADRNILADQAYNAFSAFPPDAIARIDPKALRKMKGSVPTNASLFFTIFQTFMTGDGEPVFTGYPPDFFDVVIVDECHRGGANDESEWRGILEHFAPAVQLGLTATPKRQQNADTYAYFGEPVYSYALREGIEDGFLTPFKVRQMASTIDAYVYHPEDAVLAGEVDIGDAFDEGDFNHRVIIPERELSRVREFMERIDQRQKTLVFCATQDHAALVRDLINQVKASSEPDYCQRVTANDGSVGEQHLRQFQDNDKTIPTILTTSQKLSTGVDARNIRHIVLMRPIRSMIEFKQIIGRGTRVYDGKDFFTIWDFVKAYEHFNDPQWDGEPLPPEEREDTDDAEDLGDRLGIADDPESYDSATQETGAQAGQAADEDAPPREKIVIQLADGKARKIAYLATTTYWSPEGRPISATEFLQRLFGDLSGLVADEDQLRTTWSDPDKRAQFMAQLEDRGYDQDRLDDIRQLVDAPDSDLYDVLGYVLFTTPAKTRHDRAETVRGTELTGLDGELKALLLSILKAYETGGEAELATPKLGQLLIARYGSVGEGKAKLGDLTQVKAGFKQMQVALYAG
ncbi:EcoAI/FtnUII family type I restriction enzme subunit R [Halochromatium roseum]|uniref:EcoAI/FtnUII family type I restriction enzme subunit R n=1 Tax=Halochromatium roseum TaxID=391920 RepID=UPI001913DF40|nr:DEAD/DEAH box helicase family protein [Halochromatium roseum]MBK5941665.1 restriction endonuclease subunit R [Halochromatium roseum]